jgi:hypothetical protein
MPASAQVLPASISAVAGWRDQQMQRGGKLIRRPALRNRDSAGFSGRHKKNRARTQGMQAFPETTHTHNIAFNIKFGREDASATRRRTNIHMQPVHIIACVRRTATT